MSTRMLEHPDTQGRSKAGWPTVRAVASRSVRECAEMVLEGHRGSTGKMSAQGGARYSQGQATAQKGKGGLTANEREERSRIVRPAAPQRAEANEGRESQDQAARPKETGKRGR